ncbi:MAG TPA: hypothetical protein DIV44_07845 [Leeuwenhoekiella sp.]|uniref:hypothetical protein n=1 Tax=Leeuwenhoekiella palythoae TaxID=573501 RepID=UPI000C55152A|nr:hypothetical protein [Leeuwenhoekiella palythoae]MAS20431.1 hypothetical protein [Leeuwenhoekiella sp.]MEC8883996.1 hypothetical protein [Bacteroidota bacterium]UBZ10358.1 hypothetical protein LDL79_16360 [Leeuwenhoekiella palythoae]HBO30779.1 hypothetical protein [Leeuwenhoekiella sp.]HCQ76702.1 hypothetical protein [Leeuwenhoekiella sp.]|tara:strand:+ start:423 stop:869 length:447 start_codon:yes stop_codon:yes gene_type:complete
MKLSLITLILLISTVYSTNQTEIKQDNDVLIRGTWELRDFYHYDENEVVDTVATTDGYRQIKMYTKDRVMWTRYVPKDSVEWFGYGSYVASDDQLIETLEYGSESMMNVIDTLRIFTFELQISENEYSQITVDEEGNRIFSENYKRIE